MTTGKAWAIGTVEVGHLGHGWFDWLSDAPHVHGCRTALFATRREARLALPRLKRTFPKARVVRVRVTIQEIQ